MTTGGTASTVAADAIALMVQRIVERFHPLRIILFGSHARGEARPDSDVDLLVVLAEVDNRREAAIAIRQLLKDIPMAKDIVVASAEELVARGDIPGTVLNNAWRQGIVLYVDGEARQREVRRWLEFGREDLEAAAALAAAGTGRPRHACWLAQQSVEKALKAVLVYVGLDVPRVHDLDELRARIPKGWKLEQEHADLARLSEWAVEARYPGDWPDATEADARLAVQEARALWNSVMADLTEHGLRVDASP